MELYSYKLTTINFGIWFVTLIWWSTAGTLVIYMQVKHEYRDKIMENIDSFSPLIESCYQVVKAFMLVAMSSIQTDSATSMLFNVLCILIGSILHMVILGIKTH